MTAPKDGLYIEDCMARYRSLHSILTSGDVKLLYRVNSQSVTVAWKTKNFHLFVSFGPLTFRKTAISAIT